MRAWLDPRRAEEPDPVIALPAGTRIWIAAGVTDIAVSTVPSTLTSARPGSSI